MGSYMAEHGIVDGTEPSAALDGVTVRFERRLALDAADLRFDTGQTVALMGPNGSGKTTLLRVLAGLQAPTTGRLVAPDDRVVAYVAQHQHQHPWIPLTVAEVLRMGRYRRLGLLGRLGRADRAAVAEAADRLLVGDLVGRAFGTLSGGQRQRVLVAAALTNDADWLLLDEPITGLDLPSQRIILEVVDEERDRGRLVVLSTHHLEEARHCDRVILLSTVVVADGAPDDVLTESNLAAAFGPKLLAVAAHDGAADDAVDHGEDHRVDHDVIVVDEHGHGAHTSGAPH